MMKIYSSPVSMMAYHVKNLLEQSNIQSTIKGEQLSSASGGVAPIDAWIEVWILDEQEEEKARKIVDSVIQEEIADSAKSWTCPECNESIEGNFNQCWQCGTDRPQD